MLRKFIIIFLAGIFLLQIAGCESIRKKFTRKKKSKAPQEEMVVVPKDYSPELIPREDLYREHYAYWQAAQQELVDALFDQVSAKRIDYAADQAIMHLSEMVKIMSGEPKEKLQKYLDDLKGIRRAIDMVPERSFEMERLRSKSEKLLQMIRSEFAYKKVKDYLV